MRRTPVFSATVILTVALAIVANTTIFSVVNSVLLKPLPFKDPQTLVQVAEKNDKLKLPIFGSSVLNFVSWREQSQSFEELAGVGFSNYTLNGSGEPEQATPSVRQWFECWEFRRWLAGRLPTRRRSPALRRSR